MRCSVFNHRPCVLAVLIAGSVVMAVRAERIDISTVSPRRSVQLTIYNSADLTLVRDARSITVHRGQNPLQFSWTDNTRIDPTSVDLTCKTHAADLRITETNYPSDRKRVLYWQIESDVDADVQVEISYFTSGITWSAEYNCISNPSERTMSTQAHVRITNNSGEDYEHASVRLVVGTINLVHEIRFLAAVGMMRLEPQPILPLDFSTGRMRSDLLVLERSSGSRPQAAPGRAGGNNFYYMRQKTIAKESFSEYFLYTVPGMETIPHGWSKKMKLFSAQRVPIKFEHRYRPREYGKQLVRLFVVANTKHNKLGSTPLPGGVVRVYRENADGRLSFLAEQRTDYVPIGEDIEVNVGPDQLVKHDWIRMKTRRDNVWFAREGVEVLYSPSAGDRIEFDDKVVGWDEHTDWCERIENNRDMPITVEIRRSFFGQCTFQSNLAPKLHDYQTAEFKATIPPGQTRDLRYILSRRRGQIVEQHNLKLLPMN